MELAKKGSSKLESELKEINIENIDKIKKELEKPKQ